MMIAQWVSSSRARLSLEANYLLLLQAVLTSLPAVEKKKKKKNFMRLFSCTIWTLL